MSMKTMSPSVKGGEGEGGSGEGATVASEVAKLAEQQALGSIGEQLRCIYVVTCTHTYTHVSNYRIDFN